MNRRTTKEIKELDKLIGKSLIKDRNNKKNLNHTQLQIVMYLVKHENEEVCQKDLEIETHLKKASITGTLDSMEDKGIIIRKQSEDDKRKNIIVLSDLAKREKIAIEDRIKEIENKINKNISKEELNSFFNIIDKMKKNMIEE